MSKDQLMALGHWKLAKLQVDAHLIRGSVLIDEDNPFFSGHFPDAPLLPGMAQVSLVHRLVEYGLERPLTLSGIRKLKFSDRISPSAGLVAFRVQISADPSPGSSRAGDELRQVRRVRFQLLSKKTEFSSGDLVLVV